MRHPMKESSVHEKKGLRGALARNDDMEAASSPVNGAGGVKNSRKHRKIPSRVGGPFAVKKRSDGSHRDVRYLMVKVADIDSGEKQRLGSISQMA